MKILLLLGLLVVPSIANAVLANGTFEGGLVGWETIGDVSLVDSTFGVNARQGQFQVLMTTAPAEIGNFGYEHPQSYSGNNSAGLRFGTLDQLRAFFALNSSSLVDPGYLGCCDFSGIRQSFIAPTDSLLSFTWAFLTDEAGPSVYDTRFYAVDGIGRWLIPTALGSSSATPFAGGFGYETTTIFIPAGLHTLAFGVGDYADHHTNSALLVDEISLLAVPEPSSWLLTLFGLAGLFAIYRTKIRRNLMGAP